MPVTLRRDEQERKRDAIKYTYCWRGAREGGKYEPDDALTNQKHVSRLREPQGKSLRSHLCPKKASKCATALQAQAEQSNKHSEK